ncbi:MAG: flagellar export protein FliJ [Planctomycetota bacterium]
MSRFVFRLESLLELRRRERDEAGVEVGKANEAIDRIELQVADLDRQLRDSRDAAASVMASPGLSPDRMLQQGRFALQLESERHSLVQTLQQLHTELDRRRSILVTCEAEVRRLERHREVRLLEHQRTLQRIQQRSDDDQAASRYAANRTKLGAFTDLDVPDPIHMRGPS